LSSQMSSWTLSEVFEIVRPLLGRQAKNGTSKLRNVRLRFLQRKGLPRDIQEGGNLCEFAIELNRYHAMGRKDCTSRVKYREDSEASSADGLHEEVKQLLRLKT
jgi:hypothetical protein